MEGKKEIGISELSDLFDITPEAIRKYEEKRILQPNRGGSNKYRKYSSWEAVNMVYSRSLSQLGFTLSQVSDILKMKDQIRYLDQMDLLQKQLAKEIEQKQKLLQLLYARKNELLSAQEEGSKLKTELIPQLYCCRLLSEDRIASTTEDEKENLQKWIAALPFVSIISLYADDKSISTVLGISKADMEHYGLDYLQADLILPERMCVTCYALSNQSDAYSKQFFESLAFKVKQAGYQLEFPYIFWMKQYSQSEDGYFSYSKRYFPLSKKSLDT